MRLTEVQDKVAQAVLYKGFGADPWHPDLPLAERVKALKEIEHRSIGSKHVPFSFHDVTERILQQGIGYFGACTGFELQIQNKLKKKDGTEHKGHALFAVATFQNLLNPKLSTGVVWSANDVQGSALRFGMGQFVRACANGIFSTDGCDSVRKNTKRGMHVFEERLTAMYTKASQYQEAIDDSVKLLEASKCSESRGAKLIGLAMYSKILKPRQAAAAMREWAEIGSSRKDADAETVENWREAFGDRTLWRLYNAFTEAAKLEQSASYMQRHATIHKFITDRCNTRSRKQLAA